MGYARILGNLGKGRFRIEIDSGEASRRAQLTSINAILATLLASINKAYELVLLADSLEATSRQRIDEFIQLLILSSPDDAVTYGLAKQVLYIEMAKYAKLVASNQGVRLQHKNLKASQAEALRKMRGLDALQTLEQRDAWCVDYTTTGSGYVATLEVPGDTSLVLIAPGLRPWRQGDGTVRNSTRTAAISRYTNTVQALNLALNAADKRLQEIAAEIVALSAVLKSAQEAYVAGKTEALRKAVDKATADLALKRKEQASVNALRTNTLTLLDQAQKSLAYWTGKVGSDEPDFGDGYLVARELTSPAFCYFNAAIFPAWQKWLPEYRAGTITSVDWDAGVANVSLTPTTSIAQRLNVNKESTLSRVQAVYMTSNMRAFGIDDNVIVKFTSHDQSSPQIIGYVTDPRPDPPRLIGTPFPLSIVHGVAMSANFGQLWFTGEAMPLTFSIASAETLPDGINIDPSNGRISGTTFELDSDRMITIRCSDAFFVDGKNRRYAETSIPVSVTGGYVNMQCLAVYDGKSGDVDMTPLEPVVLFEDKFPIRSVTPAVTTYAGPSPNVIFVEWASGELSLTLPPRIAWSGTYPSTGVGDSAIYHAFPLLLSRGLDINLVSPPPNEIWEAKVVIGEFVTDDVVSGGGESGFGSSSAAAAWRPSVYVVRWTATGSWTTKTVEATYVYSGEVPGNNGNLFYLSLVSIDRHE